MSMFSYGTRATCARARALSVAASTVPRAASTPRCSRYAAAARSDSCWPSRIETLPTARRNPSRSPTRSTRRRAAAARGRRAGAASCPRARAPPPRCPRPRSTARSSSTVNGSRRRSVASPRSSTAGVSRRATSSGWSRHSTSAGTTPEEWIDAEARRHRLERIERGEHLDLRGQQPDLLLGLAKRRREEAAPVDRLRVGRPAGRAGRRGCPGRCGGASRIRSTPAPSRKTGASTAASSNSRAVVTPRCGAGRRPSRAVESAEPPRRRRARPRAV